MFSVALLLMGGTGSVRAQSALDGFDPNVNGTVRVVVVQPDGKILIGGDFTTLAPSGGAAVPRNHIARLNVDGTIDTAFNPNANGAVLAIAVQSDGKILTGGSFSSISGQPRNNIARLDATTGLADSFDPNANERVDAITVQPDGKILVAGFFYIHLAGTRNSIGGQPRNHLARLDPATGLADSFDPDPGVSSNVDAVLVQADGKIVVSGAFTHLGGQTRNNLARLDPATGLADPFDPNANDEVHAIAIQADGKILAGGFFTTMGGQSRSSIARLDAATGAADSFNPDSDNGVFAFAVQADGKILVGGEFSSIGGQQRHRIARLDPITGSADSFDPSTNAQIYSIAVQADGKILPGGAFSTLAPNGGGTVTRNHIARLETDGRLDQTLNLSIVGDQFLVSINATAMQPDGKILIGGEFTNVLGVPRNSIARLNTDGTLDMAFDPNSISEHGAIVDAIAVQADRKILVGGYFIGIGGQTRYGIARLDPTFGQADSFTAGYVDFDITAVAVQSDGRILVCGGFQTIGGQTRNRIARLDPATGLPDSFDPNANNRVNTIALQVDGKILAGGFFNGANSIGGQTRNYIARLDAITGLTDAFDPNSNFRVNAIVVQPDGNILAGGEFNSIGGATRNYIARLDPTTGMADSFNPNANNRIYTIAMQADGKVLPGGKFNGAISIGGQARNYIARLDAVAGTADSFDPNADSEVFAVSMQPDGKVLAGGLFINIGGQPRNAFARLSNGTAALQNLVATQNAITWTRGGSSPQLTRVTFEFSTDNLTYTLLGNGTATGSNWTLTGLNLPVGQNIYIRARGYYRGGQFNGSESITESVRNAFLTAAPLQITNAVSRKAHGGAGDFDVPLPLTGEPGVECRSTGGAHTLVFTFSNNVVSGNAALTTGTGSVSGIPTFAGNSMTVDLTGVTDVQKISVTLSGVTDSSAQVLPDTTVSMNMLAGDTNGNKSVSASDVAQTKAQSGAAVTGGNFRNDINVSGTVTASDVAQVKANSGHSLP